MKERRARAFLDTRAGYTNLILLSHRGSQTSSGFHSLTSTPPTTIWPNSSYGLANLTRNNDTQFLISSRLFTYRLSITRKRTQQKARDELRCTSLILRLGVGFQPISIQDKSRSITRVLLGILLACGSDSRPLALRKRHHTPAVKASNATSGGRLR